MNSRGNRPRAFLTGGISLVLILFAILCLISFATLSLSSARADARLTDKYQTQEIAYAGARNDAQLWLQQVDTALSHGEDVAGLGQTVTENTTGSLSDEQAVGSPATDSSTDSSSKVSFGSTLLLKTFPMSETQELEVVIRLLPRGAAPYYELVSMRTVSTQTYEYDESLHVIAE